MDSHQVLFIFLLAIVLTNASHYRGGSLSWSIHENTTNGSTSSLLVRITQRHSYRKTFGMNTFCDKTTISTGGLIGDGSVTCIGDCSGTSSDGNLYAIPTFSTNVPCTDYSDDFDYSSGEGSVDIVVPSDVRFTYAVQSCCWIQLLYGSGSWSLSLVVDTHKRRDGKYNNSPRSASNPVVQVQVGRTHVIPIPMADTDGDALRCRWGATPLECGDICSPKGQLQAFPCQLTYEATTVGYEGVALVIEDYDSVTNETLSAIPLQFLIRIVDQTPATVLPDINYTGLPLQQACTIPPVYVGDRHHGACIGVASNTTITERIVVKVPCNESSTTITDILTVSPPGMSKGPITVDPNNNDTYIMFVIWTPRPNQYGIHQLCFTPVDSIGQNGQQVCYTFQVDVAAPKFLNGSMTPKGLVPRNQALWSISTDQNIVPPTQSTAYIRYFKRINGGTDQEVLHVNAGSGVTYHTQQIFINTGSTIWEDGAHYYIVFDSGVVSINQSCGIESAPIKDNQFWEFWIAPVNNSTSKPHTTTTTSKKITTKQTTVVSTTTTSSTTRSTKTSTTTPITTSSLTSIVSNEFCPHWLSFGTIVNLLTSTVQPNYTFCFTVNTTFADVTIAANTWTPCSTWKISGAADPFLELFTPETSTGSPIAQNDDGNNVDTLNCLAAVLSYRLTKGNYRAVVRHQKCAYGNFELRLSSETTNGIK